MDIYSILEMLCGLAFFLFGMNVMSSNLEKMAGGSLETVLKKVTANKFLSLTLGVVITAVIQSSSAVTVMLVGLVNSGIINFSHTISVVLGTNVGTTLTGWFMTLMGVSTDEFSFFSLASPKCFVPILAFIGAIMRVFSKKDSQKDIGTIMLGFSILMHGMTLMSGSMSALTAVPEFQNILTMFTNPLLALLAAIVFTGVIQSSSAAIGIFQALALNGALTYQMAFPMVLGANIGTTITAIISAVGSSRASKRVVVSHLMINTIGALIMMAVFFIYTGTINTALASASVNEVGIAVIHTLFNLSNVIIFFPLQKLVVKVIEKLIPDNGEESNGLFLDERLINTPSAAINECVRLSEEMAFVAEESILKALSLVSHYSDDVAKTIEKDEHKLDEYEDVLSTFLVKLSRASFSDSDSKRISKIQHSIVSFERLGDHALNIHDCILKLKDMDGGLSSFAVEDLNILTKALAEIMDLTSISYIQNNLEMASYIEPLEQAIDILIAQIQDNHIVRLSNGTCSLDKGLIVSEILSNCERISDQCSNIGVCIIESHEDEYNAHHYLNSIRHESKKFRAKFEEYKQKYTVK